MVYAKLKIRQLAAKAEGGSGMADYGGLSNSMMGGGLGTVQVFIYLLIVFIFIYNLQAPAAAAHQGFGHKNYDLVYGVIKGSVEEQGVDRGHINNMVGFLSFIFYIAYLLLKKKKISYNLSVRCVRRCQSRSWTRPWTSCPPRGTSTPPSTRTTSRPPTSEASSWRGNYACARVHRRRVLALEYVR